MHNKLSVLLDGASLTASFTLLLLQKNYAFRRNKEPAALLYITFYSQIKPISMRLPTVDFDAKYIQRNHRIIIIIIS